MAKKRDGETSSSKMTVMVFQFEGSDATLQEGLKAVTAAVKGVMPQPPPLVLQAPRQTLIASNGEELPALDDEELCEEENTTVPKNSGAGATRSRRTIKPPAIIDLELRSGEVPLETYLNRHPVNGNPHRALLVAHWLKAQLNIENFSADHIYTCFRHMRWPAPTDTVQLLRDMKSRNKWLYKGDGQGFYKLNHLGDNEIMNITERASRDDTI